MALSVDPERIATTQSDATGGTIDGRPEWLSALRRGFETAAVSGSRELLLCDPDFTDWPLGEQAVVEHLSAWVDARSKMVLLAAQFDGVAQRHPRWVEWRRHWEHVVECRCVTTIEPSLIPSLFVVHGTWNGRLIGVERHRGSWSREAISERYCRDAFDAVLQRSETCFPATAIGL
jgi:hypothetical protein